MQRDGGPIALGQVTMSVGDAIRKANAHLPGTPAPEGEEDPRWQTILEVADYCESNPEEVWQFVNQWGNHSQKDLRDAIACVLLEHLLESHFDLIFPRVESAAETDPLFADMFRRCWKFGQSERPGNAIRFDALKERHRGRPPSHAC